MCIYSLVLCEHRFYSHLSISWMVEQSYFLMNWLVQDDRKATVAEKNFLWHTYISEHTCPTAELQQQETISVLQPTQKLQFLFVCFLIYGLTVILVTWPFVLFFSPDVNECEVDEGDCEGFCCNTFGSYYCKCPEGTKLGLDGKACHGKRNC